MQSRNASIWNRATESDARALHLRLRPMRTRCGSEVCESRRLRSGKMRADGAGSELTIPRKDRPAPWERGPISSTRQCGGNESRLGGLQCSKLFAVPTTFEKQPRAYRLTTRTRSSNGASEISRRERRTKIGPRHENAGRSPESRTGGICSTAYNAQGRPEFRQHRLREGVYGVEPQMRLGNCDAMRRYHFHVVDGVEVFDSLGAVLPNDQAAHERAIELARGYARRGAGTKAIRVTNDEGAILFRVPIRRST